MQVAASQPLHRNASPKPIKWSLADMGGIHGVRGTGSQPQPAGKKNSMYVQLCPLRYSMRCWDTVHTAVAYAMHNVDHMFVIGYVLGFARNLLVLCIQMLKTS